MSDRQVEIMAAEDAPGNSEGGEAVSPTQATSEQPEATKVESATDAEGVPAADPVADTLILDESTAEEATVEEVEETPATDVVASDASGPDADATNADAPAAEGAEEAQLVDGPVGEVLDEPNQDEPALAEPDAQADSGAAAEEQDADGNNANVRILSVGQQVSGTVKRIADFGAFVDIGVKQDGLVHISQLADRYIKSPFEVVNVGDIVKVKVVKIEAGRGRIGLSMKEVN